LKENLFKMVQESPEMQGKRNELYENVLAKLPRIGALTSRQIAQSLIDEGKLDTAIFKDPVKAVSGALYRAQLEGKVITAETGKAPNNRLMYHAPRSAEEEERARIRANELRAGNPRYNHDSLDPELAAQAVKKINEDVPDVAAGHLVALIAAYPADMVSVMQGEIPFGLPTSEYATLLIQASFGLLKEEDADFVLNRVRAVALAHDAETVEYIEVDGKVFGLWMPFKAKKVLLLRYVQRSELLPIVGAPLKFRLDDDTALIVSNNALEIANTRLQLGRVELVDNELRSAAGSVQQVYVVGLDDLFRRS
jgi:hypothetical protein